MVYGDFWHRCPKCRPPIPKTHTEFWRRKFRLNKRRDAEKREALRRAGWRVVELWECEVREDLSSCVERVLRAVRRSGMSASGRARVAGEGGDG